MSEFEQVDVYESVVLVDRTGLGGTEIIYDGKRLTFPPGQPERIVPRFVADWLFQYQKHMVWTEDDIYTNRFAIKNITDDLKAQYGEGAGDTSHINIDGNRIEGWDTSQVDRSGVTLRTIPVSISANSFRERQGALPLLGTKES